MDFVQGLEIKAECVRLGIPLYRVATELGIHPCTFSLYINGKREITPDLASRLELIIDRERKPKAHRAGNNNAG